MTDETYTAANIRVLTGLEASERFSFARAAELAKLHPHVAPDFIARMVEACHLSGWSVDLAEQRYLRGEKAITPTPAFFACHAELLREGRTK